MRLTRNIYKKKKKYKPENVFFLRKILKVYIAAFTLCEDEKDPLFTVASKHEVCMICK